MKNYKDYDDKKEYGEDDDDFLRLMKRIQDLLEVHGYSDELQKAASVAFQSYFSGNASVDEALTYIENKSEAI